MKNKFYVFIELIYYMVPFFLLALSGFIWFALNAFYEDIFITTFLIISLLVLPFILLLWSVLFMAVQIEVTEDGLTKKLFGHKLKSYKWEEIKFVHFKGSFNQWIFLSKNDLTNKSLSRCRLSKGNIYFLYSLKKIEIIKRFAPEDFKEQFAF